MSVFGGIFLTNVGRNLQIKAQAGTQLQYTKISIGDGSLGSSQIIDLTALKDKIMDLPITKLQVLSTGKAVISTVLSNQSITSGFYFREIGVFAQDPDLGEILYCYGNAGANAEYIPAPGGADVIEKSIDLNVLTSNASNVSAVIDQSLVYAKVTDIPTKTSQLTNDSGYITINQIPAVPVQSVNNKTGAVTLNASDVEAEPSITDTGNTTDFWSGAKTFRDLATDVRNVVLTGLSTAANAVITATDTILSALGKLQSQITLHLVETTIQLAGGTANAITVNTDGNFQYTQFRKVSFKATSTNTGNVTLNVDGKGTVPFLKYDGSQIPAGGIVSGKVYDAYYDTSSSGRFFLIAKASGNTIAAHVLANDTCSTDNGDIIGTMPENGALNYTPSASAQTIPAGHTTGGTVAAVSVPVASVLAGTTIAGQAGTMPNKSGAWQGGAFEGFDPTDGVLLKPAAGYYDGNTNSYVYYKDPNHVAANIVAGVTDYGVTGTATVESLGGRKYASGSSTTVSGSQGAGYSTITGLAFTPSVVILYNPAQGTSYVVYGNYCDTIGSAGSAFTGGIISGGFSARTLVGNGIAYNWQAWE